MRFPFILIPVVWLGTCSAQADSARYFTGGSLGLIFHQQKTSSDHGLLYGKNSGGLFIDVNIERKLGTAGRQRLNLGLSLGNYLFSHEIVMDNGSGEPFTFGGSTTGSGSGYFKLYLHYGLAVAVWRDFQAIVEAGPSLIRQNNLGYWMRGSGSSEDTATTPAFKLDVYDSLSMTRRLNPGLQGGLSVRFRYNTHGWITIGTYYHHEFFSMNRQDLRAFLNGTEIDQAVSTSAGSGLFLKLGLGWSIRERKVTAGKPGPG